MSYREKLELHFSVPVFAVNVISSVGDSLPDGCAYDSNTASITTEMTTRARIKVSVGCCFTILRESPFRSELDFYSFSPT